MLGTYPIKLFAKGLGLLDITQCELEVDPTPVISVTNDSSICEPIVSNYLEVRGKPILGCPSAGRMMQLYQKPQWLLHLQQLFKLTITITNLCYCSQKK